MLIFYAVSIVLLKAGPLDGVVLVSEASLPGKLYPTTSLIFVSSTQSGF